MLSDPGSDSSLLLQQAPNDNVPAISCFHQEECRGGDEVRVLCSASAEVQVLLTAEWGQSSTSPLASTHTALAAPEVLVTTSYITSLWPHYHRVVVKFLNLY